jgi:hypothetical protein
MKYRSIILLLVSAALLLAIGFGCWLVPHLRAARDVNARIASLSHAKALVIDGSFIDGPAGHLTNITVRVTHSADVSAIASLFQTATPRLDISITYGLSHGAKYGTPLAGTVTIESDLTTNQLHLLFTDIVFGDSHTAVRLRGFSSPDIYQILKQRGVL